MRQRSPLICFTGIDGCGKSTQVKMLTDRLNDEGWEAVRVRTGGDKSLSRPLVRLGQRVLRAPRQGGDRRFYARDAAQQTVSEEFSGYLATSRRIFQSNWLMRRAWTDLSLFEHALEIDRAVWPHLWRRRAVVCDRYIYKSIVNLAVLFDLPLSRLPGLLRHPALRLAPQPTIYFLLDVPASVGFARKIDVPSIEYVERRVPIYRALADLAGMAVVDATQSPEVIHRQVWMMVSKKLARHENCS